MVNLMINETMPELVSLDAVKVLKHGFKAWNAEDHGYADGGRNWWIVENLPDGHPDWNRQDREIFQERIANEILNTGIWRACEAGDSFHDSLWIRRYGKKCLITQRIGLDV